MSRATVEHHVLAINLLGRCGYPASEVIEAFEEFGRRMQRAFRKPPPPEPLCADLSAAWFRADPNQGRPVVDADAANRKDPGGNHSHPLTYGTEAAETRHPP